MKALIYLFIICGSLFTGMLLNNTFFRAHYLGIGKKIEVNLNLKGIECGSFECELTFNDETDIHSLYSFQWRSNAFNLQNKIKAVIVLNEHGQRCLIEITDGYIKEDFSHLSFCYPLVKQSEDEWIKSRLKPIPN